VNSLERLTAAVILVLILLLGGAWWIHHYSAEQYQAGWDDAVAAGKEQRDGDASAALAIESGLRTRLLEQDTTALRKEQEYASKLEAAERRVRAGTDRLRCPAASPVQPAAPPGDRPTTAGAPVDGQGPDIVPEAAADLLGIAADVAGLVRRYERVVERFEDCRAVNAK
jgi:hypothetical protein